VNRAAVASPTVANRKKRILLVDSYPTKRDLRAKILRKLGVEVDCASDISEARSLWQADSYNLVLMDVKREPRNLKEFCAEIADAKPPQRMAFLVGKPEYLAHTPGAETEELLRDPTRNGLWSEMVTSLFTSACELLPQRYGFLEASWRIAATRSLKDPRQKNTATDSAVPADYVSQGYWNEALRRHAAPAIDALGAAATTDLASSEIDLQPEEA
jgi:CheY-like chemotaxis protein